ncbi:MAG: 50S ribosomal protein L25 [Ignavibacteria bacterium]|jgi:large subunit ribosomal protein L25|nr:50S ribosomal protein L25 [Ignavibacteria bacterium]
MLEVVELKSVKRETGKQASKRLRANGEVPGIYYSKGFPNLNVCVNPRELRPVVHSSHVKLVHLDIEGQVKKCVLKEVKFHPVTDKVIHFDLLGIQDDQKITVQVPFEFIGGQPVGVRKGGTFQQVFHKCKITCLPKYLVSSIQVDVSKLDVAQSIHLRDLNLEGIEFGIPEDSLICAVQIPRGKAGDALREGAPQ